MVSLEIVASLTNTIIKLIIDFNHRYRILRTVLRLKNGIIQTKNFKNNAEQGERSGKNEIDIYFKLKSSYLSEQDHVAFDCVVYDHSMHEDAVCRTI